MKIGDYVYVEAWEENDRIDDEFYGKYFFGKIIDFDEDGDVRCYWSEIELKILPKTIQDFENIIKDNYIGTFLISDCMILNLSK